MRVGVCFELRDVRVYARERRAHDVGGGADEKRGARRGRFVRVFRGNRVDKRLRFVLELTRDSLVRLGKYADERHRSNVLSFDFVGHWKRPETNLKHFPY